MNHGRPFRANSAGPPRILHDRMPIAFLGQRRRHQQGKAGLCQSVRRKSISSSGAAQTVASLRKQGYLICVVTNQSPIARGLWGPERLELLHATLQEHLLEEHPDAHIDAFLTCPHRYEDRCSCRKPSPAMLFLGHRLLREESASDVDFRPVLCPIEHPDVDWWGAKPFAFLILWI